MLKIKSNDETSSVKEFGGTYKAIFDNLFSGEKDLKKFSFPLSFGFFWKMKFFIQSPRLLHLIFFN